jgi:long-chain acyl-CoA synthetase
MQKIRNEIKTLSNVILMSEKGGPPPDGGMTYSQIYDRGTEYEKEVGTSFFTTELRKAKPSDLLTVIYTSGTTGNPKGVMLTNHNMASNINASARLLPMGETDVLLSFLPLCHSFERMAGYYTAFACGCTVAYAESVDTVRDNLLEVRPTIVATVPRLFERIHGRILKQVESSPKVRQKIFFWALDVGMAHANARRAGSIPPQLRLQHALASKLVYSKLKARTGGRIRFFVSGGAALPEGLGRFFEAVGILVIEGYGLTETSPVLTCNRLDDYKFGTVGRPIPGVDIEIAKDGEILAKARSDERSDRYRGMVPHRGHRAFRRRRAPCHHRP